MRKNYIYQLALLLIMMLGGALSWASIAGATPARQDDTGEDMLERGAYLVQVAGCIDCHTPFQAEYNVDPTTLTLEQLRTLSLFQVNARDGEMELAGGRVFDLGPGGIVTSRNLTSHSDTGLGAWTDEEIKTAIRTGVTREGRQLHPLMPYRVYNQMADDDLTAIVTYLRTLEPIENEIPVVDIGLPPMGLTMPEEPIVAPDPEDAVAYGEYLFTAVIPCTDCHTPLDENTGTPNLEMFLAGGQPFEGPWGIVYGGNITPHDETGIGDWSDDDIRRVLTSGVQIDGRRVIVMPWQDYAVMSASDVDAMIAFLHSLDGIENEIPEPAVQEPFIEIVELSN